MASKKLCPHYGKLLALLCFVTSELIYLVYPLYWEDNEWGVRLLPILLICASAYTTIFFLLYKCNVLNSSVRCVQFEFFFNMCFMALLIATAIMNILVFDAKAASYIFYICHVLTIFGAFCSFWTGVLSMTLDTKMREFRSHRGTYIRLTEAAQNRDELIESGDEAL